MNWERTVTDGDLELRIQRLEAVNAIQNLMSTYEYYHSAYQNDRIPALFVDREDIEIDMVFGRYRGRDAARRFYVRTLDKGAPPPDLRGEMVEHQLNTPIIEVAGDCQTAKAVWSSPGQEAHVFRWMQGTPRIGFWSYGRYSVDFINTDNGWRIWKLRFYQTFATDYYSSWVEDKELPGPPNPKGDAAPDLPASVEGRYSLHSSPALVPVPPVAYETYEVDK